MELVTNSRTLNKRSRYIFPVSSYLVFVSVNVGLVLGVNPDIHMYKMKLTPARWSRQLIGMFPARSWLACTNKVRRSTVKHERPGMLAVHGKVTLKINGNGTRYQIVQVTSLFFRLNARTCQTKRFFKQSYVHFLESNLFASCPGTRVRSSNWLENCQLHAFIYVERRRV